MILIFVFSFRLYSLDIDKDSNKFYVKELHQNKIVSFILMQFTSVVKFS